MLSLQARILRKASACEHTNQYARSLTISYCRTLSAARAVSSDCQQSRAYDCLYLITQYHIMVANSILNRSLGLSLQTTGLHIAASVCRHCPPSIAIALPTTFIPRASIIHHPLNIGWKYPETDTTLCSRLIGSAPSESRVFTQSTQRR